VSAPGEGQGGYGQWDTGATAMPPPQAKPRNGMGIAALVLGILAILFCWTAAAGIVFGILAIIFGAMGAGRARRGAATNRGVAIAGIITGVLGLIVGIVFAVIFAFVGFFFTSNGGQNVVQQAQECVRQQVAQGADPAQAQKTCGEQIGNQLQRQYG
jgi:hypothetical protein